VRTRFGMASARCLAVAVALLFAPHAYAASSRTAPEPDSIARIRCSLAQAAAEARASSPLTPEAADRFRIQQHLARVEAYLRAQPTHALRPALRRARERNLDVLHAYWSAGVFPRNTNHPDERRPYFIDDEGRACAVAHLVIESGHRSLAEHVDRRMHNAYVPDMDEARLSEWAAANGLSVADLALIQPAYCQCGGDGGPVTGEQPYHPVCGSNGLTYWNQCAANLCGSVSVEHDGECTYPPRCELCGIDTRLAVVSECGWDSRSGVCDRRGGDAVVAVNETVAERWLELQRAGCPADTVYPLPADFSPGWHGVDADEDWNCSGSAGNGGLGGTASSGGSGGAGGGSAGGGGTPSSGGSNGAAGTRDAGAAGASSDDDSSCSVASTQRSSAPWPHFVLLALVVIAGSRRRRGASKP